MGYFQAIQIYPGIGLNLNIMLSVPSLSSAPMFEQACDTLGLRKAIAIDEGKDIVRVVGHFSGTGTRFWRFHVMYRTAFQSTRPCPPSCLSSIVLTG